MFEFNKEIHDELLALLTITSLYLIDTPEGVKLLLLNLDNALFNPYNPRGWKKRKERNNIAPFSFSYIFSIKDQVYRP